MFNERLTTPRETARGFAVQTERKSADKDALSLHYARGIVIRSALGKLVNLHSSSHYNRLAQLSASLRVLHSVPPLRVRSAGK